MRKILVVLACVGIAIAAGATTYYAAPDGTGTGLSWATVGTLETAMNRAGSGDSVWVKEGTYTGDGKYVLALKENVSVYGGFAGSETLLSGRDVISNETVIDGEGARRCVAPAENAVLDGFSIINGKAKRGGAMYVNGQSLTLNMCKFAANMALDSGGALFCDRVSEKNTGVIVSQCYFYANRADWDGGAVYNYESKMTTTNTAFIGNTAQNDGGGIFNYFCSPTLTNCTFTDNNASRGGALRCIQERTDASAIVILNSILWGDNADEEIYLSSANDPDISYSCLADGNWGNLTVITADPVFDSGGALGIALDTGSPCIDAGYSEGEVPTVDLLNADRPEGEDVDMGALEYGAP